MFAGSTAVSSLGGIGAVISSLIAAYGSFAEVYNDTSLKEAIPLGVPKSVRERRNVHAAWAAAQHQQQAHQPNNVRA
jgi:hypothetical protein